MTAPKDDLRFLPEVIQQFKLVKEFEIVKTSFSVTSFVKLDKAEKGASVYRLDMKNSD
jgi:hypothetical protein